MNSQNESPWYGFIKGPGNVRKLLLLPAGLFFFLLLLSGLTLVYAILLPLFFMVFMLPFSLARIEIDGTKIAHDENHDGRDRTVHEHDGLLYAAAPFLFIVLFPTCVYYVGFLVGSLRWAIFIVCLLLVALFVLLPYVFRSRQADGDPPDSHTHIDSHVHIKTVNESNPVNGSEARA